MEHIGKQIGKYTITKFIGEGGMASVYEGEHEALGTKAAIKILNPILSANKQIRERFKNEARIMASLDHPNITRVLDFEENDSYLAIAMELLSGEDLSNLIKSQGKLSEKEIIHVFEQTLSAFEYAHNLGIVHRDIKPSNIFVSPNGTIKILDFGIAKLFGQGNEMTQTGVQIGTPIYMSPEQVKGDKSIDHRSDIYSLGVTMYYALQGEPPYDGNTSSQFDIFTKIVHEPLPEVKNPSFLADLIRHACAKDRAQRFQSCEEWLQALKLGITPKSTAPIQSDKTIGETSASDKTIIEAPNQEKAPDNTPLSEKTDIEETPYNGKNSKTNEPVALAPKKNRNILVYSLVGILAVVLIFLAFIVFKEVKKEGAAKEVISFEEVTIGNQIWMAENLNVSTFRNGDPIPEAKSAEEWEKAGTDGKPAWCYYENDLANSAKYGKLYNWYALNDARGLAPEGYHVPTDDEWTVLTDYLGGDTVAGTKMKSTSGWSENGNGRNESGFSGLPGGVRENEGSFLGIGYGAVWWSASEDSTNDAYYRYLILTDDNLFRHYYFKGKGLSVRCLRD